MKFCLSILFFIVVALTAFAQQDTSADYVNSLRWKALDHPHPVKKRASAYDTTQIYFNKWKVNLYVDGGFGNDAGFLSSSKNNPGVFGYLNPYYTISPAAKFDVMGGYGITEKSMIGVGISFQSVSVMPLTSVAGYLPGTVAEYTLMARYTHCINTWKYFYYGFGMGAMILNSNLDTNAYLDKLHNKGVFFEPVLSEFIGARYPFDLDLWFHAEYGAIASMSNAGSEIMYASIGINYCFDTRTTCHKPVKIDPYYEKLARKRARADHTPTYMSSPEKVAQYDEGKPKKPVYDTLNKFYNKGKMYLSISTGTSDLEGEFSNFFGTVNSNYNQKLSPMLNVFADYGITEKSRLGLLVTYEQNDFTPIIDSAHYYTPGNISMLIIDLRYTHCMWSWKNFYYGLQLGQCYFGNYYNQTNTFVSPNKPQFPPFNTICFDALIGAKINLSPNLALHGELVVGTPINYFAYGITYSFKTRFKFDFLEQNN